jgi:hypothetical protein
VPLHVTLGDLPRGGAWRPLRNLHRIGRVEPVEEIASSMRDATQLRSPKINVSLTGLFCRHHLVVDLRGCVHARGSTTGWD